MEITGTLLPLPGRLPHWRHRLVGRILRLVPENPAGFVDRKQRFVPFQLFLHRDFGEDFLHQFGAVALFALILRARFLAQYPLTQSVRG